MREKRTAIITAACVLAWALAAYAAWPDTSNRLLRAAYKRLFLPELDGTVSHAEAWPGEEVPTSRVEVHPGDPVVAGSYIELRVIFYAGAGGIAPGGGVRVAFEHAADWGGLQVKRPERTNYASVRGPEGVGWDLRSNQMLGVCALLEAVVDEGVVPEGAKIEFVLGDRSGGSPGFRVTTVSEVPGAGRVRVFEDRDGSGNYYTVPGVPELKVIAGPPVRLRVIARSWSQAGKSVDAVVHVDDRYGNVVSDYHGWFEVTDAGSGKRLGDVRVSERDRGVALLKGVRCKDPGILRLRVKSVAGGLAALANPVECIAPEAPRTVFGSIHNHTLASDGLNTMEGATRYARDVSNLDFFALTEHVIWPDWDYDPVLLRHAQDRESWERAAGIIRDYNSPGKFVTILGFEWTTTMYGDKNVYFFDAAAPFREFPPDQPGLYRALQGERALVITHTMMGVSGMRGPRWEFCDRRFEKVMEIASFHGVREYAGNAYPVCDSDRFIPAFLVRGNLAEGALQQGLRLGFTAGADDHSGKPGAGNKGILSCSIDGLTGARLTSLDREQVFSALENRATFATTGARMLLDFSVNRAPMGSEISTQADAPREIRAEVYGESAVSEVAVVRVDPREPVRVWRFDPPRLDPGVLEWTDPEPLSGPVWYYLRVIQSDRHMGWSSPVWVDPI